jgi:hypothetical protein
MTLYQGKIGLKKSDYGKNENTMNKIIIQKINRRKEYDNRVNLLAAALTCFAMAGLLAAYLYGG